MKRANITLTCLLFLIASFNIHSQEKIHVDQTTTSTIRLTSAKDRLVVATTTRRFTIKELYDAFDAPHDLYLLKEEFRSERQIGTEGQKGTVTVDAWLLPDEKTKVWSISQNGDEGEFGTIFIL